MTMGKLAVAVLALSLALAAGFTAMRDDPQASQVRSVHLEDEENAFTRRDDGADVLTAVEDDEPKGDGDATGGNDGTNGGDNTGDGDATGGNDGTNGGDNTYSGGGDTGSTGGGATTG
jgi:hypothetical protein